MTSEARAALREKVFSITKVCAEPCKPDANDCPCRVDADAAIDVALEEAARVCDAYAEKDWARGEGFRTRAALDLAAAIRGLISYTQDAKRG
jgi:hypothetical protein